MGETRSRSSAVIALIGLLVLTAACTRSIQAQSSSKEGSRPAASAQPRHASDIAAAPALFPPPDQSSKSEDIVIAKADPSTAARVEEMRQEQVTTSVVALQDVFFEFDRWNITAHGRQLLVANADWLRSNPDKKLTIQGHCDERGTAAYNMVLGEKRAQAIRSYLVDLGIKSERLGMVSYGKERPFCQERSEVCYQQNRRGHLVVRGR
jgi:peptidoglycan-associated lipoprotein